MTSYSSVSASTRVKRSTRVKPSPEPLRELNLDLFLNSITDVSPLAALTQLTAFNLRHNSITDLTPLAGLTQLTELSVHKNPLSEESLSWYLKGWHDSGRKMERTDGSTDSHPETDRTNTWRHVRDTPQPQMPASNGAPGRSLRRFLEDNGSEPYREVIQAHVQQTTESELRKATVYECSALKDRLGDDTLTMAFIDRINEYLTPDREFFRQSSRTDAAKIILKLANEHFGLSLSVKSVSGEDDRLAFGLFQIATLTFAYTAAHQPKAREQMGIEGKPWYKFW